MDEFLEGQWPTFEKWHAALVKKKENPGLVERKLMSLRRERPNRVSLYAFEALSVLEHFQHHSNLDRTLRLCFRRQERIEEVVPPRQGHQLSHLCVVSPIYDPDRHGRLVEVAKTWERGQFNFTQRDSSSQPKTPWQYWFQKGELGLLLHAYEGAGYGTQIDSNDPTLFMVGLGTFLGEDVSSYLPKVGACFS